MKRARRLAPLSMLVLGLALASLAASAGSALAAGSWWHLSTATAPTTLVPGAEGQLDAAASNLGYEDAKASVASPIQLTDTVPQGLEVIASGIRGYVGSGGRSIAIELKECKAEGQTVTCKYPKPVPAYEGLEIIIPVKVAASPPPSPENTIKIEGGEGTPAASVTEKVDVGTTGTPFGVERYELRAEGDEGEIDSQAGSHPFQLTTTLDLNQTRELNKASTPPHEEETVPNLVRDLHFVLPPGLLGNVNLVAQCTSLQFATIENGDINQCPAGTAIGAARIKLNEPAIYHGALAETVPVFNLVPAAGEPARFGIEIDKVPVILSTSVRTGKDYAVEVSVINSTQAAALIDSQVTFWGVPGDSRHDAARGWECIGDRRLNTNAPCQPLGQSAPKAFLTLPTSCASTPTTTVSGDSWPSGTGEAETVYQLQSSYTFPTALSGCASLAFEPSIKVEPDSHAASTPTGLAVKVEVQQGPTLNPTENAEADVQDTTLTLPEGVQASPGAANGLLSCSSGSIGLDSGLGESEQLQNDHFSSGEVSCPEASKIGSVSITTPLLKNSLTGWVYLASQDTNPFASPLVLYVVAYDKESGVRVKLAGEVRLDPSTGRLTSEFQNTPPLPFDLLDLHLFGESRASQSTPPLCGSHETSASFVPSSGEASHAATASFQITEGAGGSACQYSYPQTFAPSIQAGSATPQAGSYSGFSLTINHSDADQPLSGVAVHLPEGVAAMLSHVTPCPEPPVGQEWACGAESLVGEATTSSGLGGSPVTLKGSVYLTSGYDGAPFGLLVSTLAQAGPFNLGIVNVRSRINVDPNTAAVTVTTDPGPRDEAFPTILKGVPVQLKAINVNVNRPEFQFNPTNCAPEAVTGTLSGSQGGSATASYPFNAANCSSLPFAPKLTATAGGQASKPDGASLNVTVADAGLGQSNIAKVDLTLPLQLPSRLSTIQKACVLSVFEANPAACDEGSVIGKATIQTPVLKSPLMGPAYLVSHGGAAFPDVEFVLQGEGITLVVDGKTDIKKGITYSRFESTPDAPFTKFVTELPTGPHSALTAYVPGKNYSLCGANLTMPTVITGQNGAVIEQTTPILATGCTTAAFHKITRAQKLAKALKLCRKLKKKAKRASCEARARKRYGAKKPAKKKASKKKR